MPPMPSQQNDIAGSSFALVDWCARSSTSQWHGLGAIQAGCGKEPQLFTKAKASNFSCCCFPWPTDQGLGTSQADRSEEPQLFAKAKASNFSRCCFPWLPDQNDN